MSESVPTVTITTAADLKVIKRAVRTTLPSLGSGHAGECIARGLQRSTYDGLVFELAAGPITTQTDPDAFARRAAELGATDTSTVALRAAFAQGVKGFEVPVQTQTAARVSAEQIGRDYARAHLAYDAGLLAIDDHTGLPRPNPGSVRKAQEFLFAADDFRSSAEEALAAAGHQPDEDGDFDEDLLDDFRDGVAKETARMAAEIAEREQERLHAVVARLSFRDTIEALQEGRLDPVAVDFATLGRKHAAELIADGEFDFDEFGDGDEFDDGIEDVIDSGRSDVAFAAGEAGYEDALVRADVKEYAAALTEALCDAWAASRVDGLDERTKDLLKSLKADLDAASDNPYTRISIVADRLAEQTIDMLDLDDYAEEDPRVSTAEGIESWFDGAELADLGEVEIWGPYLGFDLDDETRLRKAVVEATASLVEERLENGAVDPVRVVGAAVGSLLADEDEDLDSGTLTPVAPRF